MWKKIGKSRLLEPANRFGKRTKYERKILPLIFDGYESQNKNVDLLKNDAL